MPPRQKAMPGCKPCPSAGRRDVQSRRFLGRTPLAWCREAEGTALAHPTLGSPHSGHCLRGGQPLSVACGDPQQKQRLRVQVQTGGQKGVQLTGITTDAPRAHPLPGTAAGVSGDISHTLRTGRKKGTEMQGRAAAPGSEAAGARPRASRRPSFRPHGDRGLPAGLASSPLRPGAHQKGPQSKSLYSPEDRRHSFPPDGCPSPRRSNGGTFGVLA